jgi:hypothetical protein
MLDLQGILGSGAKGLANSVAVLWTPLERPKNQHVQSSLKEFDAISIWFPAGHPLWKTVYHSASAKASGEPPPAAPVMSRSRKPDG